MKRPYSWTDLVLFTLKTKLPTSLVRRVISRLRRNLPEQAYSRVNEPAIDMPIRITAETLNDFVAKTDELGGPNSVGAQAYWAAFRYVPSTRVDQSLDPFGQAYFDDQLRLYEEISGRTLDQPAHEQLEFDITPNVSAHNPYNHPDPSVVAGQLSTLATVCKVIRMPGGANALDMGCGWGLSSETLAYCGYHVDAVDINPNFVRLVNARAKRLGLPIKAVQSTFDDFAPPPGKQYDFSLFYECFHHAPRPWELMARVISMLKFEGKFVLATEPVQATHWRNWGLRLDPLSVYCIRKYGWFESGWSLAFLQEMFTRNNLKMSITETTGVVDAIYIGEQVNILRATDLKRCAAISDWWHEETCIVSNGDSVLLVPIKHGVKRVDIELANHSAAPIRLRIESNENSREFTLLPGGHVVSVPCSTNEKECSIRFKSDPWCPNDVFQNGDRRTISLHVTALRFGSWFEGRS